MARQELKVIIRAKDHFSKTMKNGLNKTIGAMNRLKKHWLTVTIAMTAATLAFRKVWDLTFSAARFQQQEQAFTNLAASHGENAQKMIVELRRLSAQTIATADLMQSAGTAMLLGIPADRLAGMMEIARASSRITGQSVQAAFDDISKGVGRQSKLILDNLGIMVSIGKANEAYAKSLGIVGRALTDVESKQAFLNAVMEAGEDTIRRVGDMTMTSAEAMQALQATIQNTAIWVGKGIGFIATFAATATQLAAATVAAILGQTAKFVGRFMETMSNLPFVGETFEEMSVALGKFAEFEFRAMDEAIHLASSIWDVNRAIFSQAEAITAVTEAKKVQEEFFPLTGLDAFTREEEISAFEASEKRFTAITIAEATNRQQIEKNLQKTIFNMRATVVNQSVGLLTMLGQKNKALAIAAIAFEKGVAIARTIVNTRAAMLTAMAVDPSGVLAARVKLMGALSVAIIGATGIAQAANLGGGGAPSGGGGGGGVGALPIAAPDTSQPTQQAPVNITINAPIEGIAISTLEALVELLNSDEARIRDISINGTAVAQGV